MELVAETWSNLQVKANGRMSNTMVSFSVHSLPRPAPDHDTLVAWSARLKDLRLKSLKSDADSWISTYESEVGQPEEFWLSRLQATRACHLVLVRDGPPGHGIDTEALPLLQGDWVGFVVIIGPEPSNMGKSGSASSEYLMSALFIDAELRGYGLGKRLVQEAMTTVRHDALMNKLTAPYCTTSVRHGNDHALKMYQKLGFRIVEPVSHGVKEGRQYTSTVLRTDL